jgi:hypothetical protein
MQSAHPNNSSEKLSRAAHIENFPHGGEQVAP